MSLQGVLSDFGLADVFQLISQQRKSGTLEITRSGRVVDVHFVDGSVASAAPRIERPDGALGDLLVQTGAVSRAELEAAQQRQEDTFEPLVQVLGETAELDAAEFEEVSALLTKETLFELFGFRDGRFVFRPESKRGVSDAELLGTEGVLLDTMRMRDEWPGLARQLPDGSVLAVPRLGVEALQEQEEALVAESGLTLGQIERLFSAADGARSARRVIARSRLGTFNGTRALTALARLGLVELEQPPVAAGAETGPGRPRTGWKRVFATLAVAGAVLFLSAFWEAGRSGNNPIPVDVLGEARDWASREQLRLELEAHRWKTGKYPDSLAELGSGPKRRLAADQPARYIYARSPGGYTLYGNLP